MNRTNRCFRKARWPLGLLVALWAFAAVASAPPGQYTIPGDGTVHDTKTGLVWQQAMALGSYTWNQAGSYCAGLSLAGTGWRLPSVKELMTLLDFTATSGVMIDIAAFPNTPAQVFWSSSPLPGYPSAAWSVAFSNGSADGSHVGSTYQVRCVR